MTTTYNRLISLLESVNADDTAALLIASAWSQGSINTTEANMLCSMHGIADIKTYWKNSRDSIV